MAMGCYPVTPRRAEVELGKEGHLRPRIRILRIDCYPQFNMYCIEKKRRDGRGREEYSIFCLWRRLRLELGAMNLPRDH